MPWTRALARRGSRWLSGASAPQSASVREEARAIAARHLPSALFHVSDIVPDHAMGSWIVEAGTGRKFLDFTTGIGVTNLGHCHPRVVEAIQQQAAKVIHAQQNVFDVSLPVAELCTRLAKVMPDGLDTFLFVNSGSEAAENAVKVARAYTGRPNVIAFTGSYHGRTYGAMALTSSKTVYMAGFSPLMPGVRFAPFPYWASMKHMGLSPEAVGQWALEQVEWVLKTQTAPGETAAMILEPILGEGGFVVPPQGFLEGLREICDRHSILLVFDEVQSGMGRTGQWWAHETLGRARPDMVVFAKGIASGMPMGGIAARPELFSKCTPASLGGTYGGNPIAAAAACATIDAMREEGVLRNAAERGAQLSQRLHALAKKQPSAVLEVRGKGLMMGVEFDPRHKGMASRVAKFAQEEGLLLMTAGAREVVRFLPPLTVNEEEVNQGFDAFERAVARAQGASQP